jgi:hypothetical protein
VSAKKNNHDDEDAPTSRDITDLHVDDKSLKFTSSSNWDDTNTTRDRFKYALSLFTGNSFFNVDWDYSNAANDSSTQYQVKYYVEEIVEYDSTSTSDGIYSDSAKIFYSLPVPKLQEWSLISQVTQNGSYVYTWSAFSSPATLVVSVAFLDSDRNLSDSNFTATPNQVKLGLDILNYKWVNQTAGRIALVLRMQSKQKIQTNGSSTEVSRLNFEENEDSQALFGWSNFVLVNETGSCSLNTNESDCEAAPVEVESLPSGNDAVGKPYPMYFSFMTTNNTETSSIFWDPTVGVEYTASGSSSSSDGLGGGAVAGIVIGVLIVVGVVVVGVFFLSQSKRDVVEIV